MKRHLKGQQIYKLKSDSINPTIKGDLSLKDSYFGFISV